MIDWEYIDKKRKKFENEFSNKALKALRKTIMPVIRESRLAIGGMLPIYELITGEHITSLYYELYLKTGKSFIKDLIPVLRKDFEEDLWEIEMIRYIEDVAGQKITLVTNYTKKTIRRELRKVLDEGLENGLSFGDIMKKLRYNITRGDYAKFTKARALRIAKTEVMTAANQGSYTAAYMSGMTRKKWLTAPFGIAKEERHNKIGMNGQERAMDQPFDVDGVQMMYPGDPAGGAQNVIECNCNMTYL
jgi:hypothetical protein